MSAPTTRLLMRAAARELADEVNSTFVTDATIDSWINLALTKLHDLMVAANPDWWLEDYTFQTTVGTKEYALPTDFYQARGVDMVEGTTPGVGEGVLDAVGEAVSIESYNFLDRNRHSQDWPPARWIDAPAVRYRIIRSDHEGQGRIRFEPDPGGRAYRLWYVKTNVGFSFDEYDGVNGWEEYVIADVAIKMMIKSESDPSAAMALKAEAEARINRMAPKRDQGRPVQVADTRRR